MKTRLQVFHYRCGKCRQRYDALHLPDSHYGLFLMRTPIDGELAILDALHDEVYDEVDTILKKLPETRGMSALKLSDLLQGVFSVACDPSASGCEYSIVAEAACPGCGAADSVSWVASEPPVIRELQLESPTHKNWLRLSASGKISAVRRRVASRK